VIGFGGHEPDEVFDVVLACGQDDAIVREAGSVDEALGGLVEEPETEQGPADSRSRTAPIVTGRW
jgi:hypothetical protein